MVKDDVMTEEFYNLMQAYRHSPLGDQTHVGRAYEAVVEYVVIQYEKLEKELEAYKLILDQKRDGALVAGIKANQRNQEYLDEIEKLRVENEKLRNIISIVCIQTTTKEYLKECGDELDGITGLEAWDSLIIDVRRKLNELKEAGE